MALAAGAQTDMVFRAQSAFTGNTPAALWTNGVVPYVVDSDIPQPGRFTDAVTWYNANTPMHFQPRVSEVNFVHLVHSTIGNGVCSSNVGMIGGEQFLHVEDACTTSTLIHEMGHTVGFYHEQSRHDRNLYITILYENINKTSYSNFAQNGPPAEQDIGVYDYASHMHYSTFEGSAANLPSMQTVPAGIPIDTYTVLSPGDLDTLFRMYGQPPTATTLVTDPPGLQMTIDGQTVTSPQVVQWAKGSTHTVSAAGQISGGLRYLFGRWSDGGAATHTITADPSVTFYSLNFIQQTPLSVGVAAGGGGTAALDVVTTDGYAAVQTVFTMTATPAAGYTFLHWNGGTACPRGNAASPSTFVVGITAINCIATFTQTTAVTTIVTDPLKLPVVVDGVSYVQTPVKLLWTPGTSHSVSTAAPDSNPTSPARYIFQSWSDGGAAAHTVTAGSGATTLTASYKTQYSLSLPTFTVGVATVTASPASSDGFYDAGTSVQVTATPGGAFKFNRWTGDLTGQPNPGTLVMDSQEAVSAVIATVLPVSAIVNSATFANQSVVAPGEIVTIFKGPGGTNAVGPDNPVLGQFDSSGKLGTVVANTTVTFGGMAAPIIYASANQTNVIVPYGIAGQSLGSTVNFLVTYNGKTTPGAAVVDSTAPGFFTVATSGLGPVLAANQDGTLNSPSNPAARGSVVTFYGTGAGLLSPGGNDGVITGLPLPVLTQPISVRIGGKPAELPYAGAAPLEVSGVLQVNAKVPLDAPSGDDSVYLVLGINSTPAGVTLSVR